jgi:hypothetical protein
MDAIYAGTLDFDRGPMDPHPKWWVAAPAQPAEHVPSWPTYSTVPEPQPTLTDAQLDSLWIKRDCIKAIQDGDIMAQVRAFARTVLAAGGAK